MYECAVAWLSCSGRLSRMGEDYRVGWRDMGGVTKDSIQKLYFKQRIRPLIHALQQPQAASHPPSASRINQQNSRLIPLSFSISYYFRPCSNSPHLSLITTSYSACHCYSCSLVPTCNAARLVSYGYCWLFVFLVLPHIANFRQSADGGRKTELQRYAGALAGWRRKRRPIYNNGVVVLQPLAHTSAIQLCIYAASPLNLVLQVINICRSSPHVAIILYRF